MAKLRTWNDVMLKKAVSTSYSVRAILIKLNLVPAGGNYQQVLKRIDELSLDTSHFTGQGWRKNRTFSFKAVIKLEDILV